MTRAFQRRRLADEGEHHGTFFFRGAVVGIPIGIEFSSPESLSLVKSDSCLKCQTEYLYRLESPRVNGKRASGPVACPECGWHAKHGDGSQPAPSRAPRVFLGLFLSTMAVAGIDKLFLSFGLLGYWPVLLGVSCLGAVVAHLRPAGESARSGESNVTALASRAVTLGDPGEKLDNEALERELYHCLRSAMLSMAAIDGDIDPSEMIAISRVYANVTEERVDIGTLERQAQAAMGKQDKMLDTLDCLAPYLHPEGKAVFLKAVLVIAAADGKIDPNEVELVKAIGEALNMDKGEIGDVVRALKNSRVAC